MRNRAKVFAGMSALEKSGLRCESVAVAAEQGIESIETIHQQVQIEAGSTKKG